MAKPPKETSDRFQVFAECSVEEVGNLLRALTIMGLNNVGYELIHDVPTYRHNNVKKHAETALEFAMAWIAKNPSFEVSDLVKHFLDAGRNNSQAYGIVKTMTEQGELTKTGPKTYQRGGIKALPAPPLPPKKKLPAVKAAPVAKGKKPHKRQNKGPQPRLTPSNRDLILATIAGLDNFLVKDVQAVFRERGRKHNSVSPIITKMYHDKMISSLGDGRYRVLAKANKQAAKLTEQPADSAEQETDE